MVTRYSIVTIYHVVTTSLKIVTTCYAATEHLSSDDFIVMYYNIVTTLLAKSDKILCRHKMPW